MKRFFSNFQNERALISRLMLAMFIFSCAAVLAVSLYSRSVVAYLTLEMEINIQSWLKETSRRGAAMITAEELASYQTPEDMSLPGYHELRKKLVDFAAESGVLYVYYLRPTERGKFQFIIDNDFDENTRVGLDSPPDDVDETPGLQGALDGKVSSPGLGSYMTDWGGLLSAYAPIFDARGNVAAVCGIDINDELIVSAEEREKLLGILEIAAVILVLASGALCLTGYRREARLAREAKEAIVSGIKYASKIQNNLLPLDSAFKQAFSDHSVIWKPKDIVGGDIYWIKNFDGGAVLCVCDCTGHGTPGALLTMLVVAIFEATVNESNCRDTAQIIWELEKRLVSMLTQEEKSGADINDGCDLAVLFAAKDGTVSFSSGNIHVFVCDGREVTRHRGQRIRVGDGALKRKEDIKTVTISAAAGAVNKFYIASDGLYEQIGGGDLIPFGYDTFSKIILERHNEKQSAIAEAVWSAFEDYRGNNPRRDDFELVTFQI
ncbi:MAG: SpoIIE family protein phosphatase [Synergistaceae bacterium]|nr:SpoIIE family protein phosphatase [Synergistaceae bacterium]